jgi:hypothetical protein
MLRATDASKILPVVSSQPMEVLASMSNTIAPLAVFDGMASPS